MPLRIPFLLAQTILVQRSGFGRPGASGGGSFRGTRAKPHGPYHPSQRDTHSTSSATVVPVRVSTSCFTFKNSCVGSPTLPWLPRRPTYSPARRRQVNVKDPLHAESSASTVRWNPSSEHIQPVLMSRRRSSVRTLPSSPP